MAIHKSKRLKPLHPGEVLKDLLTFYFVEVPKSAARRTALNQKLSDAGHKPML